MGSNWAFDKCFNSGKPTKKYEERSKLRNQSYYFDGAYNELSSYEKSFQSMIDILGNIASSIEFNKENLSKAYIQTTKSNVSQASNFWFINLRGFYLNYNINKYTRAIQTVHERLVQILETFPASIPQPILLRRWNSSSQELFLARYSRHAKWEIYKIIKSLQGTPLDCPDEINDDWKRHSVLHTWVHHGTSTTVKFNHNTSEDKYSTISIQSSYFYLEQPQLFPLIYHEIAHHFIDEESAKFNKVCEENNECSVFIQRLNEVSRLLNVTIPRENLDDWVNISGEVWTDALAIASCGKAFLSAISLQIFGLNGSMFFALNQGNLPTNEPLNISEHGEASSRLYGVHEIVGQTIHDLTWEARLQFSCWLLNQLSEKGHWKDCDGYNDEYKKSIKSLTEQIEHNIEAYHKEAETFVYASELSSGDHMANWNYRISINKYLLKIWKESFEDCVDGLLIKKPISNQFILDEKIKSVIENATEALKRNIYKDENIAINIIANRIIRIEDCAMEARNAIAQSIKKLEEQDEKDEIPHTINYLDFTRSDGSTAFRLALEWHDFRRSIFNTLSDVVQKRTADHHASDNLINGLLALTNTNESDSNKIKEAIQEACEIDSTSKDSENSYGNYLKTGQYFENFYKGKK